MSRKPRKIYALRYESRSAGSHRELSNLAENSQLGNVAGGAPVPPPIFCTRKIRCELRRRVRLRLKRKKNVRFPDDFCP